MKPKGFQELQEAFKDQGMRLTYQRKVILDILRGTKSHPSAEMVYASAKRRIPNVSLGTVYRNLNVLKGCGMIQELDFGSSVSRYDANTSHHYHVRCIRCDKVEDVDLSTVAGLDRQVEDCMGYRAVTHRVEFQGVCPECWKG